MLTTRLQGDTQLRAALESCAQQLLHLDDTTGDQVGAQLATVVQRGAPVYTGHLAKTVTHTGPLVTVATPYVLYVHAANPWAARALEKNTTRILDTYEDAIAAAVARIG